MTQKLDYAAPARQARAIRLVPVFLVAAVAAFALSTGFWSRQFTGWTSPGRFNIDATRTEWGLPRWLSVSRVSSTGAAPAINSSFLPAAGRFQPGWHVSIGALCLSVGGCLAAGAVVSLIVRQLSRRGAAPTRAPLARATLGALAAAGAAAGWVSDTTPDPENVLLMFLAILLAVSIGAFFVRTYAGGLLLPAAAVGGYWWASRMQLLRTATDGRIEPDEVLGMSLWLLLGVVVAAGAVFLGRRRAARAGRLRGTSDLP